MIGIYKITNIINEHCYIGQSRNIPKRWKMHQKNATNMNAASYNYPLQRAFRKYGINNFTFEILEECSIDDLNQKELYWITQLKPEYNQTINCDYIIIPQKLTLIQVQEIQQTLLNKPDISNQELACQYQVHTDTIRDINVGRTWVNDNLSYPLRISKYDKIRHPHIDNYCLDCGQKIAQSSKRCVQCENKKRGLIALNTMPVTREELKKLIRTTSFVKIGIQFNVSDNTIRKWCDKFNLPRKKSDIKKYSDEEWTKI